MKFLKISLYPIYFLFGALMGVFGLFSFAIIGPLHITYKSVKQNKWPWEEGFDAK